MHKENRKGDPELPRTEHIEAVYRAALQQTKAKHYPLGERRDIQSSMRYPPVFFP